MKYCDESNGMITYRALPFPLPIFVQQQLKESALRLAELSHLVETSSTTAEHKRAVRNYTAAQLEFEQQEELIRAFSGIEVTRPIIESIAPVTERAPIAKRATIKRAAQ